MNMVEQSIRQMEGKIAEIAESSADFVREHSQLDEQVKEIKRSRPHWRKSVQSGKPRSSPTEPDRRAAEALEERRKDREQQGEGFIARFSCGNGRLSAEPFLYPGKYPPRS